MPEPAKFEIRPFQPAWWLRGPHLQTLGGRWLRLRRTVSLRRERLHTADGDFLNLDWPESTLPADAPLVLVLHGLEGCASSGYVRITHQALAARGVRSVGLNFRSCGGEPNLAARFYHAGETGDLAFVVEQLAERFPDAELGALGFSLGGNVLLKWLGEIGAHSPLRAAAAVSVPFDLAEGGRALQRGLGPHYSRNFMRSLRRKLVGRANALKQHCDLERGYRARTLPEFDDAVTAPLHGFRDVHHYYSASSSVNFLSAIRVPTLLLHSADDPFFPAEAIPRDQISANPWLVSGFTARGGHVGFVAGSLGDPEFWAEGEATRFLAAMLPSRQPALTTTHG